MWERCISEGQQEYQCIRFMWGNCPIIMWERSITWKSVYTIQNQIPSRKTCSEAKRRCRTTWRNSMKNPPENPVLRPRGGIRGACTREVQKFSDICVNQCRIVNHVKKEHNFQEFFTPKVHALQNDLSQWVLGIPLCHSSQVDDRLLGGFVPPEVRKDQLSQYKFVNYLPKNDWS